MIARLGDGNRSRRQRAPSNGPSACSGLYLATICAHHSGDRSVQCPSEMRVRSTVCRHRMSLTRASILSERRRFDHSHFVTLYLLQADAETLKAAVAAEQATRMTLDITTQAQRLGAVNCLAVLSAQQAYRRESCRVIDVETIAVWRSRGGNSRRGLGAARQSSRRCRPTPRASRYSRSNSCAPRVRQIGVAASRGRILSSRSSRPCGVS